MLFTQLIDTWSLTKKHIGTVITFILSIHFIIVVTSVVVYNNHLNYVNNSMSENIIEYDEIDREQLCKIAGCKYVIIKKNSKTFYLDPNTNHLKKTDKKFKFDNLYDNLYIDGLTIALFNVESNSYYVLAIGTLFTEINNLFKYLIPILLIFFITPLIFSIKREHDMGLISNAGNEAMLANKSMIMITENIHHELNTPLEVIDNKIEKIHRIVDDFIVEEFNKTKHILTIPTDRVERNKRLIKLEDDFDFIRTSSEQIYSILEKMKGFKHLRYSNGNKSVKNITEGAFKIISISNTNFSNSIDDALEKYSIDSEHFKNADLLSIMINHIKNSLEANASKIIILLDKYEKGKLYIRIIDNGNGIPPKFLRNIFEPNFSTKNNDNSIRGNGMYLNKQILSTVGGAIKVIETSKLGTTIEIVIPTKIKKGV